MLETSKLRKHLPFPTMAVVLVALVAACGETNGATEVDDPAGTSVVAAVRVMPESTTAVVGESTRLRVEVVDGNGRALTGERVTWTSSDSTVATVDSVGEVLVVDSGAVRILASAKGISGSSKIRVSRKPVAAVSVTPGSATMQVGQTTQLTATTIGSSGVTLTGRVVTWSSGSSAVATVDGSGRVTGRGAGGAVIRATSEGKIGEASVTVVAVSAATLQSVVLTPAIVSLNSGATQQFSVSGQWSNGATTAPTVTYSATGGTSTATGLYTAGTVGGAYRLIATNAATGLADTSSITIAASPAPPSPLANECGSPRAGWVWCDDFDVDRIASYFEVDNAGGSFARVSGVGNAGSYGMRARWSVGQVGAGSLHLALGKTPQSYFRPVDAGTANYRELYWRVYVRNQPGWVGGGGDKLSRAFVFGSSSTWAQAMIAHVWSGDANTSSANLLTLDPARGTDEAGNLLTTGYNDFGNMTFLGLAKGTNPIFSAAKVGVWHCVEARARLNDAGSSNGVMELWVDGVLDASKTGLNFLGGFSAYGLNAVYLENYWNAGSPAAQERYLDNLVVSTQRIGC